MGRRLCLVTGASAGIGQAMARQYAAHGYDLVLTARRMDRLERLARELRESHAVEAYPLAADLAEPSGPRQILRDIGAIGRPVDALVNNAGFGLAESYLQTDWRDNQVFLQVLVVAVAELTHMLLPGMVERRFGRILNVGSLAGLIPALPGYTLYGGAKCFVIKFSEALHIELRGNGVHVTALCPGFTHSEFHDVNRTRAEISKTPRWLWMSAEAVAAAGYRAVEANQAICVPGLQNKLVAGMAKALPRSWALALMAVQAKGYAKF